MTIEQNELEIRNKSHQSFVWGQPIPLSPILAPDCPYPVDTLPSIVRKAVVDYQQYGQQPLPLIACSALANMSLSCQSLANVARDNYLISPVSLYFLIASGSGTRKTAADNVFSKAARHWETLIRKRREPEVLSALTQHQVWQMEKDSLFSQIKRATHTGEDSDYAKEMLDELIHQEPEIPLQPTLYFEDATQEALAIHLAQGWPSASLWSDEAGIILGSHSMQGNPTRFVALLNRLWDGKTFTAHRKTTQGFTIENRRLTLNLMMQPLILQQLTKQASGISRQSGFLARCLMAYPANSMGNRFYQEPPASLHSLTHYEQRVTACLNQSEQLSHQGCIQLPLLKMSVAAKQQWILFFNAVEAGLKPQGQWVDVVDFASKAAENTARLAALFHLFEGRHGDISVEHTENAIEIISWHLQEARRIMPTETVSLQFSDALKLMDWFIEKNISSTTLRTIQQLSPLRDKIKRDQAVELLVEHNQIRIVKSGSKTMVEVNPRAFKV
ncbi:YfjI family protein [Legionella pneumophila serogroup 1]|uniref:YfjI family protein n=1 Tax=Fluoribacter dumoffii TaxID=463 RepID=UPI00026C78ED|nr:YfjI family protein [Fluoribacter dumoffii]